MIQKNCVHWIMFCSWWSVNSSIISPCLCIVGASWVKIFPAISPIMQLDQTNIEEERDMEAKVLIEIYRVMHAKEILQDRRPACSIVYGAETISSGFHFTKCRLNCNIFRMQSWQNLCYNSVKINRLENKKIWFGV